MKISYNHYIVGLTYDKCSQGYNSVRIAIEFTDIRDGM